MTGDAPERGVDRVRLLAAAALFSTGGAAIKLTSLSGWQVACLRSAVAAPALLLLVPAARRSFSLGAALVGLAYAGTVLLFVLANKNTTAANAIFLQSTAPLYLLLLGPLVLREPVRARDFAFLVALGVGLWLLLGDSCPACEWAPDPTLGDRLAIASGLTWAMSIGGLRWLASRAKPGTSPAAAAAVSGNAIAALVALPFAFPLDVVPTQRDWALVAWLGVAQIGLAYALVTRAVRTVPAFEASLLLLLEPVLNPLWAYLVEGEQPTPRALWGCGIVLVSTAVHAIASSRAAPAA
jgi:drug/metabolite transporter (DMT)-like permease